NLMNFNEGYLSYVKQLAPYLATVTIILVVMIVWTIKTGKKIRKVKPGELTMLSVDEMKKKGLLTQEEFEKVRKRAAERELERIKAAGGSGGAQDLLIMQEAMVNPDAVKKLMTPEEQALLEARKRQSQVEAARQGPQPAAQTGPKASEILMGTAVQ